MTRNALGVLVWIVALVCSGCFTTAIAPLPDSSEVIDKVDATGKVTIQVESRGYEDPADSQKLQAAILLLEKVLNSSNFRERVKAFKFNKRGRNGSLGFSNDEILAIVLSGTDIDTLSSADSEQEIAQVALGALKLKLSLDKVSRREIGHTNMETNEIFTGIDWFRENDLCEVTGHYLHEYSHTVGFGHTFFNVFKRSKSVPYGLGEIGAAVAKELAGGACTSSPGSNQATL
jgi:hypothetical protein